MRLQVARGRPILRSSTLSWITHLYRNMPAAECMGLRTGQKRRSFHEQNTVRRDQALGRSACLLQHACFSSLMTGALPAHAPRFFLLRVTGIIWITAPTLQFAFCGLQVCCSDSIAGNCTGQGTPGHTCTALSASLRAQSKQPLVIQRIDSKYADRSRNGARTRCRSSTLCSNT